MKDESKSKGELIAELEKLRQRLAIRWVPGIGEGASAEDLPPPIALLRATLESTDDGILVVDSQGKLVAFNKRFKKMWRIQEPIATSEDNEKTLATVASQLKDAEGFRRKVQQLYDQPDAESFDTLGFKDGRCFERYSRPLVVNGKSQGRVWSFRDVTDRVRFEAELRENKERLEDVVSQRTLQFESARDEAQRANEAKREFLARMSHEIRTPLNGVIGLSGLLLKSRLPPREHEYAEMLNDSAEVLLNLVEGILDFSKIEAGKISLNKKHFHIHEMLRNTRDLLTPLARERGLDLRVEASEDHTLFNGDRDRVRQVLLNLIGNAIKFTTEGYISVSTKTVARDEDQHLVRFEVRDTGIGVPESAQSRIFERFERSDQPGTELSEGAGLGLAICKILVELMGGEIGVRSHQGGGSTFWFTVPLTRDDVADISPPGQPETRIEAKATANGHRILVVEDNPVNQLVTQRTLEDLGYFVGVAADGLEALEALSKNTYDLVLMDCRMPNLDGYETTRRIRQKEVRGERLPIVALTAQALREDLEKCLEAGMDDYLSKPIREADLQAAIVRWLR